MGPSWWVIGGGIAVLVLLAFFVAWAQEREEASKKAKALKAARKPALEAAETTVFTFAEALRAKRAECAAQGPGGEIAWDREKSSFIDQHIASRLSDDHRTALHDPPTRAQIDAMIEAVVR